MCRSLIVTALRIGALAGALGCRAAPAGDGADLAAPGDLAGADAIVMCRTDKIDFPQSQGCANDGSVEFCVPADDGRLLRQLAAIDPAITCRPGGGRARCTMTELLCFLPTRGPSACLADHGAMTDAAWARVCHVAALPQVRRIVHTVFE
jgi:hypothetical protein